MDEGEKLPTGGLFRLQPNLAWHKMIDGIICSNALCLSPDSRVKYHADSGQRTVWAWDFNPATGDIDKRRRFRPDRHRGRRSRQRHCRQPGVRLDPTGEVGASPATIPPVASTDHAAGCSACPMFGGPCLDIIFVTSAAIGLSAETRATQPQAGRLFAIKGGVKRLPEVRFRG